MPLLNIKKEKEDLEKLVNSFRLNTLKILVLLLITIGETYSQDTYRKGETYIIDTITVAGLKNFSDRTVVTFSGLREGQSIQVPGDGKPIILLSDHPTIGGYPKIANVISADYSKLVQKIPGTIIKFKLVDLAVAESAFEEDVRKLGWINFKIFRKRKYLANTFL